jgi:hypothetical protein
VPLEVNGLLGDVVGGEGPGRVKNKPVSLIVTAMWHRSWH